MDSIDITAITEKWEELSKAIKNKTAFPAPSSDHLVNAKYGVSNIPGAEDLGDSRHIGITKHGKEDMVIRHGAAAHRTAAEHEMSKLLGADHMMANQSYDSGIHHPEHHQKPSYDRNLHGGTSIQEFVGGEPIYKASDKEDGLDGLRNQWKNGDLHKLWALHYISNNGDMHGGNFMVGKDGVKAFDSDHAFYELPLAHIASRHNSDNSSAVYAPFVHDIMPSYLHPFVNDHKDSGEGIESSHATDQPSSQAINEHAKGIDPEQFASYGKHALERARKAKTALMSADPTAEMLKLWKTHSDKVKGTK